VGSFKVSAVAANPPLWISARATAEVLLRIRSRVVTPQSRFGAAEPEEVETLLTERRGSGRRSSAPGGSSTVPDSEATTDPKRSPFA
jgi:hypothetical protein